MIRLFLLISFGVLVSCKSDDERCLAFAPSDEWPSDQTSVVGTDWAFSFSDILGLQHGQTPVELCSLLHDFDVEMSSEQAGFDDRLQGIIAPRELTFDGEATWLGSGETAETSISAFFSAPPSGSQLHWFSVSQIFTAPDSQPQLSDVVDKAISLFGPASVSSTQTQGRKRYLWAFDEGNLLTEIPAEGCAMDHLSLTDFDAMKAVENPCEGFIDLRVSHLEDDAKNVEFITLQIEDRKLFAQSGLIDDAAAAELSGSR